MIVTLRRWFPLLLLSVVAVVAWQTAEVADVDEASVTPIEYPDSLTTPILSARRIPETLRAPVVDDDIVPVLTEFANISSPYQYCLFAEVDDRILTDNNSDLPLIPASNQKLLTTFAALEHFGPDHQFITTVRSEGPVVEGVLTGNLYLVGGGDPYLFTDDWGSQYTESSGRFHSRLEDLADAIAATGISQIDGSVIGDESLFDTVRYGPWAERLITPQQQSGPLSALSVNQGYISWPAEFANFAARTPTSQPALQAADRLAALLVERGIGVGSTGEGVATPTSTVIAEIASPPIVEMITHINAYSDNFGAEIMLKQLGLALGGIGSTEAGATAVRSILTERGFDLTGVEIYDGSGLAETDRVTCGLLAEILDTAGADSAYADSLSIGGVRGSLLSRFDDTPADGFVFAKTGTLGTVTALSGYVESPGEPGTAIIFSYIANGQVAAVGAGSNVDFVAAQNPFIISLTDYPDGPTIDDLDPEPAQPTD